MVYRFASFQLDLERFELRSNDEPIHLQPRLFDLLRYLVEQAPRTVGKDELLEHVWEDTHTSDGVLTQAVSQLRRLLSESEDAQRILETVRARGYRIAVPVEREGPGGSTSSTSGGLRVRRSWIAASVLLVALALVFGFLAMPPPRAMETAASPPAGPGPSLNPRAVAVLPFQDESPESPGYLGDSLAEEVMGSLSRYPGVLVVARNSAFSFKGSDADTKTVGERLGVAHVVEGSVRRSGDHLRVTAQLVDARTGFSRWFHSWEGDVDTLFEVQQGVAREVAARIALSAQPDGGALPHEGLGPRDFRIYDAYLHGIAAYRQRDRASLQDAVGHFEQALDQAPDYADAWAGLAAALGELWVQYSSEPRNGPLRSRAEAAARRALELDPENAQAMRMLAGPVEARGDEAGARALLARASELRPNSVEVNLSRGAFLLRRGEFTEALGAFQNAVQADPFSAITNLQFGRALFYSGDPEAALRYLDRAAELNLDYPRVEAQRAIVLRALGRSEESREAFLHLLPPSTRPVSRALTRILGDDTFVRLLFALGSLRTGDPCVGKAELAAHVYAAIGQADDMFTCLRREVLARDPWYLAVEPIYDPYRNDPRFEELLQLSRHASEPPARKSAATDRTF